MLGAQCLWAGTDLIVPHCDTWHQFFRSRPFKDWLIDYLRFYVPLKNFSLIWRRHHCRWRAAKFRPMLGAQGLWAGRDLYCATPDVTQDLGFSSLIRRTAPFSRLSRHTRGCGGSILTRILTGDHLRMYNTNKKKSMPGLIYIFFGHIFIVNYINNKFPKYQEFVDLLWCSKLYLSMPGLIYIFWHIFIVNYINNTFPKYQEFVDLLWCSKLYFSQISYIFPYKFLSLYVPFLWKI
jgi:hypothetical protein